MTVSRSTLQTFIGSARHLCHVSIDDLRNTFPIDTMSAEDIATIISRLEDENISIEIDPALLSPGHGLRRAALGNNSSMAQTSTLDRNTTSQSGGATGSVGTAYHATKKKQYDGSNRAVGGASSGFPSLRFISWLLGIVLTAVAFMSIWLMRT